MLLFVACSFIYFCMVKLGFYLYTKDFLGVFQHILFHLILELHN